MADSTKQYDISPERLRLERERNARRNVLRQEYQKLIGNPYRAATGEGGFPFDSAFQRYLTARVRTYDYFRPTARNGIFFYGVVVIPISALAWMFKTSRDKQEHLYRTGQVSYADRRFKFI